MTVKDKEKPSFDQKPESSEKRFLILHNDEVNTFDHVIETLVDVCEHDEYQAEQCALITHFNGKCDVKKGELDYLKMLKEALHEKGLSASID